MEQQSLTLEQRVQLLEKELLETRKNLTEVICFMGEQQRLFYPFFANITSSTENEKIKQSSSDLTLYFAPFREIQYWQTHLQERFNKAELESDFVARYIAYFGKV